MSALANDLQQMAGVRPAYEVAIRAFNFECVGQGQAAHDVAAAHKQGGIGAENNAHRHLAAAKSRYALRTGTPAAAKAALAPAGVCSVK